MVVWLEHAVLFIVCMLHRCANMCTAAPLLSNLGVQPLVELHTNKKQKTICLDSVREDDICKQRNANRGLNAVDLAIALRKSQKKTWSTVRKSLPTHTRPVVAIEGPIQDLVRELPATSIVESYDGFARWASPVVMAESIKNAETTAKLLQLGDAHANRLRAREQVAPFSTGAGTAVGHVEWDRLQGDSNPKAFAEYTGYLNCEVMDCILSLFALAFGLGHRGNNGRMELIGTGVLIFNASYWKKIEARDAEQCARQDSNELLLLTVLFAKCLYFMKWLLFARTDCL